LLDRVRFSITIADEEYNRNHFITPRPYEHAHHNIINFVDDKFDPDYHLEPCDSFYRVGYWEELQNKMKIIRDNQELQQLRLLEQRTRILPQFINGNYVYEKLGGNKK